MAVIFLTAVLMSKSCFFAFWFWCRCCWAYLFFFLSIIFENTEGKFSKGRGEHVTCSGEALVYRLEFLQRLPSVPRHPYHLRCQQVRQVLTVLITTQKCCESSFKVLWKLVQRSPKLSKANSAPLLVLLWNQVKPGGFNWGSLWGLVWFPEVQKQNLRCEKQQKLWKAVLGSGWNKAREGHKATGSRVTPASPSASRVAQTSDSELSKTSTP